jgi:hypothetical protein
VFCLEGCLVRFNNPLSFSHLGISVIEFLLAVDVLGILLLLAQVVKFWDALVSNIDAIVNTCPKGILLRSFLSKI